ncbi:hypothetical protein ACFWRG_14035 [Micromonospora tulbaghiae]|uniref:hypothetical protein n=1 Tax=Micromonospora tulbaghiae TaxID=479978 RepID=UPI003652F67A
MLEPSNGNAPPHTEGGARLPPDAAFDSTAATEGVTLTVIPHGSDFETPEDEDETVAEPTDRHRLILAYIKTLSPIIAAVVACIGTLVAALVR